MTECDQIITVLKRILKSKGITYTFLSKELGLSEASVKRVFSRGTFTLVRLEEICQVAGIALRDLVRATETAQSSDEYEYSEEQEKYLARNPGCLALFDLLIDGKTIRQIQKEYHLPAVVLGRYLGQLEKLGLIERLADEKTRLLVSRNVKWRKDGPLRKHFLAQAKTEFLDSVFDSTDEVLKFLSIQLTTHTAASFHHRLSELAKEITRTSEMEEVLRIRTQNYGILLAMRQWKLSTLAKPYDGARQN